MHYYKPSDFNSQVEELRKAESERLSYFQGKLKQCEDIEEFRDHYIKEKLGFVGTRSISFARHNELLGEADFNRACISSITHRIVKNEKEQPYNIRVYQGFTEVKRQFYVLSNQDGVPPKREKFDIHGFSKSSRLRLIKKCNMIRHENMPMPYFMHLTYHENVNNCKLSKRDLDNFLKRLRRLAKKHYGYNLRYIWKMEFQKRGAIHYHLAVVIGETLDEEGLKWFRQWTGNAWADVTDGSGKQREVGTRIDNIENWKAFSGYVSKYCSKPENNQNEVIDYETGEIHHVAMPTGRFWGMSQNWDLRPFYQCTVDRHEKDEMRDVFTDIATSVYQDRLNYISKKKTSDYNKKRMLKKAQKAYYNQCRAINLEYSYSLYSDGEMMADIVRYSFNSVPPGWLHTNS